MLFLYSFLIATSFPVGEAVSDLVIPTTLNAFRFLFAAAIVFLYLFLRGALRKPDSQILSRCAVISLSTTVFFNLMFKALDTASALNTGAIFTTTPLLALVFGYLLNGAVASRRQILFMLIGAVGAVLVVFEGEVQNLMAFELGYGERLFILGSVAFALYTPLSRYFLTEDHAGTATAWILLFTGVTSGVFTTVVHGADAAVGISGHAWIAIVYLAVFTTALTFFIFTAASTRLSPFKVTSFVYLTPAIVALVERVVYGHMVSMSVLVGIVITAIATILVQIYDPA